MAKEGNFNVPVEKEVAEEFSLFNKSVPGHKGDKLTAAIKAVQAIYCIDKGLYFELANPKITNKEAKKKIIETISQIQQDEILRKMKPAQRALIQEMAIETAKRLEAK